MNESVSDKVVLTEKECAERLGLSFWTLRKLRIDGNAPHIKLGSRIYYVYDAIVKWLAQEAERMDPIRTG
ncbi:MAG: helix-turn-helix domain-containing protein [Schwartzia sp.]|nr:helix-turn-helix domain-containing protein [Schwartzia sp. (in: firmicutes)]